MHINQQIIEEAWQVLRSCTTSKGVVASSVEEENYQRIWSRDGVMAGLVSLFYNNEEGIKALRLTLDTLWQARAKNGQIPSNVSLHQNEQVSFGTLAGRIDATTWWLVGAGVYLKYTNDGNMHERWKSAIADAFALLHHWELNQGGLVYTPLGGNWADEYLPQGYVLYDQLLRLWALRLFEKQDDIDCGALTSEELFETILANYSENGNAQRIKHPFAHGLAVQKKVPYFWYQFGPQGYDTRWDMAANALALLLGVNKNTNSLVAFLKSLAQEQQNWLLPAFYPIVREGDKEWELLHSQFMFAFKNQPHHFHNGGAWPIFLGWLAFALAMNEQEESAAHIRDALIDAQMSLPSGKRFYEYWDTAFFQPGGKQPLAYSATGVLLASLGKDQINNLHHLFA